MKFAVLVIGCLIAGMVLAESTKREMWSWKDSQGVTHYSDRPVPGARRIELTTMTPENVPQPQPSAAEPAATPRPPAKFEYDVLEIWQPEDGQSFFGLDSQVTVRVRSDPELQPGHQLRVYLDSQPVEKDPLALEVTLGNLERGAHSITAQIVDENGTPLALSDSRVFHIRQPGLNNSPNVGPALKPKPPPPKPKTGGPKSGP